MFDSVFKKVKKFDLLYEKIYTTPVVFENNKLKTIESTVREGIGLRIINKNKIGFSSTTDIYDIDTIINKAIENSYLGEKSFFSLPEKKIKFKKVKLFSNKVEKLTTTEMIEIGNYIINKISKFAGKEKIGIEIEKKIIKKILLNSNNIELFQIKTLFLIIITIMKVRNNEITEFFDYSAAIDILDKSKIDEIIKRLKFTYENANRNSKIKSGYYPVYFTPKAFSTIINLFIKSFDGKLIEKKVSFFTDKLNKKFYKNKFNLIDIPHINNFPFSTLFDGDGNQPKKIYLIRNGNIKNFVLDAQTAGKLKVDTNGHCVRDYQSLPAPGFTNIIFEFLTEDKIKKENSIIKSIPEGVIVDQFIGSGQSNIIGGEFSANIGIGYYVQNGEIKGRIKDSMIVFNLFDFFDKINLVSNNKILYNNVYCPGILVEDIPISTQTLSAI